MSLLPTFLLDSLDEVVFEGRNQAYGAYQLRHEYQRNLLSAGGITLLLGAFLTLGWATWQQFAPVALPQRSLDHFLKPMLPPTIPIIEHPKVAVLAPPHARAIATHPIPTIPTQVAKDDVLKPRPTPPAVSEIVDDVIGPVTPNANDLSTTIGEVSGKTAGSDTDTATPPASSEPFIAVEKMPEFTGGQEALLRYLRSHLRYPSAALTAGIGGRVFLSFVIQADGSISEVTVLKGLGYGLDDEAQRVVRQMPNWTPGYQSKHPVAVRFTLPITFQYQ
ncbi:MAG: energy transducer TonB [Janthinobacterium lividum]